MKMPSIDPQTFIEDWEFTEQEDKEVEIEELSESYGDLEELLDKLLEES